MNGAALVCLIGSVLSVSALADDGRRDGNWWRESDGSSKMTYVTGFFDGMDLGYNFSYWGDDRFCKRGRKERHPVL